MNVWDDEGREYIDTFMGIGVLLFGHNHPVVVQAMKEKMDRYASFKLLPMMMQVVAEISDGNGKEWEGFSLTLVQKAVNAHSKL